MVIANCWTRPRLVFSLFLLTALALYTVLLSFSRPSLGTASVDLINKTTPLADIDESDHVSGGNDDLSGAFRLSPTIHEPSINITLSTTPPRSSLEEETLHSARTTSNSHARSPDNPFPPTVVDSMQPPRRKRYPPNNPPPRPPTTTNMTNDEPEPECSCMDSYARWKCCERWIFRYHKFGSILAQTLFAPMVMKGRVRMNMANATYEHAKVDYRHVIITRQWYDAMVSGYLYHKAGYECWLYWTGEPRRDSNRTWSGWETNWTYHQQESAPHQQRDLLVAGNSSRSSSVVLPNVLDRSICQYLADESEETGVRAIMDFAINVWYRNILEYWEYAQTETTDTPRTIHICFEDLSSPATQASEMWRALRHWFPAGDVQEAIGPRQNMLLEDAAQKNAKYEGSHSTDPDPERRQRLYDLVKRLDQETFGGRFAAANEVFNCGHSLRRSKL